MNYFEDIHKQEVLEVVLNSWMGTPYRHWSGVKGEGCDCIHFIARVFEELGMGPFKIEHYSKDWHLHNTDELLLSGLSRELNLLKISAVNNEPMNGDIVLYKFGKASSHSAIYYDGEVYQSINGIGVEKRSWLDKQWFKRRTTIMRLVV